MILNQNITHVRGKDLVVPVTVTLDQGRTLDGMETWKWVMRLNVTTAPLVTLVDPTQITIDGTTKQPSLVFTPTDFLLTAFPDRIAAYKFLHALEMTKDSKKETTLRGTVTLLSDIVD